MERKNNQSTPEFRRMTPPPMPPYKRKIELALANHRVWDEYKDGNWIFSRGSWENVIAELTLYNF